MEDEKGTLCECTLTYIVPDTLTKPGLFFFFFVFGTFSRFFGGVEVKKHNLLYILETHFEEIGINGQIGEKNTKFMIRMSDRRHWITTNPI